MATGIFTKVKDLVLGNIHELLDKKMEDCSPAMIKQHIRELEKAMEGVEESVVIAQGDLATENDHIIELKTIIANANENIELILGDGDDTNDGMALTWATRIEGCESELATHLDLADQHQANVTQYETVLASIKAKHASMLTSLRQLESAKRMTDAKNRGAKAIEVAAQITGATPSVDNLAATIKREANIADARLNRALSGIKPSEEENMLLIKAKARIEEMKKSRAVK